MTKAQLKRYAVPALGGLLLVALSLGFQLTTNEFFKSLRDRMEWMVYDLRLKFTLPKKTALHPIIAIVDIDEKSLGVEGRWPWPRTKIADLADKLFEQGVSLAVFDVFFVEPERNIALLVRDAIQAQYGDGQTALMNTLNQVAPDFDGDAILARALSGREIVLGHLFLNDTNSTAQLPPPLPIQDTRVLQRATIPVWTGHTGTLPAIVAAARRGGFTNGAPDADGNIRRSPLVLKHQGQIYPALALEASRAFLATDAARIKTALVGDDEVVEFISLDFYDIPTNGKGEVLVPYRGKSPAFQYISATDVLHGNVPEGGLEGMIVFIGTTAQGLGDLRATPVGSIFPGVEIHANFLAGILDQNIP
ncbi:MAG: CHASE2 domain-containing protein, partial [Gammaproteobacteria bacterium]